MIPKNVRRIDIDYLVIEYEEKIDEDINFHVTSLANRLRESKTEGIIAIIPTYCSILVEYNPLVIEYETLRSQIDKLVNATEVNKKILSKTVVIPVLYGGDKGPDLAEVARINKLSEEEVIDIHSKNPYRVYMIGFNPGYPYMGGLDKRISVPRLDQPRTKVPAGSVAIGGEQTGIYSTKSPGGWRLIGHTPIPLFNPKSNNPVLLKAGDNVKFESINEDTYRTIVDMLENNSYELEILEHKNE